MESRFILALDRSVNIDLLNKLSKKLHGVKIGVPLIFEVGINGVRDIVRCCDWNEVIFDLKLADISSTMIATVSMIEELADSVIAHVFIGIRGALDELKRYLDSRGINLYLVTVMSHPGWDPKYYFRFKNNLHKVNPYGLVIGATFPKYIKTARKDFPDKVIISPGIGVQGALPGDAICSGADFEIIGRSVYLSSDPVGSLNKMVSEQHKRSSRCAKKN